MYYLSKILEDAFDGTPVIGGGSMHELAKFADGKSNTWSFKNENCRDQKHF